MELNQNKNSNVFPANKKKYNFPKKEHLKSKKIIQELFGKGSSSFLYPFKIYFILSDDASEPAYPKVLISVSKKYFKKAVDRNRIKRQTREAYRLHKSMFKTFPKRVNYLGILYIAKEKESYHFLEKKLVKLFTKSFQPPVK